MPRVSRRDVSKTIHGELDDNFAFLISSLSESSEIKQFFQDFLTDEEKTMLTKRLMLHLMLEQGYNQSQIKTVLSMSRETIRVHKRVWERGGTIYKMIIRKIAKREKTKQFWKTVEKILQPLNLALQAKTNMKTRAKLMTGLDLDD